MIKIKRIDESSKKDINLPNEPFSLWGKMIPTYDGNNWAYTTRAFDPSEVNEMVFPNENYDFDALIKTCIFVGAYDENGICVGVAMFRHEWLKYLYLEDLKICKAYRGQGIGYMLLEEGKKIAAENAYRGIYTIGQDNNLSACLFYMNAGFEIGGFDTHVYGGTNQADKSNIYFYLDV